MDSMDIILTAEQEELRKRARVVLSDLRATLASAEATDEERTALADSIRQLDELFMLVIAGEFNSGKSSFINALMGQKLQEEGVTPTTGHIHLLKYGDTITQTTGEKGVWVHTAPVPLLRNINIVDTPGTNAINREHEALTTEFIPRSDLVLFVSSADRPFSQSERDFLEQIREWGKKIVLVINKVDILANDEERAKVLAFVQEAANRLLGDLPAVFPVSAKLAQNARSAERKIINNPKWQESGFEPMEQYIHDTLDDNGRFRLKMHNPLGVGLTLSKRQLNLIQDDLNTLKEDSVLLGDIEDQMTVYQSDMRRNFQARLGEIDNLLFEMERRGNDFFDETIRLGRIPDLLRKEKIQAAFEQQVVAETPAKIENRVSELIDWMVEQELRQWTAVSDHLQTRRQQHAERIVGQGGAQAGSLAYDRQRLIDSIGLSSKQALITYNKEKEASRLAESAREAVINTGIGLGGAGLGVAVALLAHGAFLDVTGITLGIASLAFGFFILPSRRRKAKQELSTKLAELRSKLITNLTEQFDREMRRSVSRIEDTVAPYSRFVRAEQGKIDKRREQFEELEAHIVGLQRQIDALID